MRPICQATIVDLAAFISVNAMAFRTLETFATIPTQFRQRIPDYRARDDPTEHVVVGGRNVPLIKELGLKAYLSEFDTVAGSFETGAAVLRASEDMVDSTFIATLPEHAAPLETIRGSAEAQSAM